MKLIKLIGMLIIIAGILGLLSPLSIGGWVAFTPQQVGLIILYAILPYIGIILSVVGLVFGIATLKRNKWTWKANLVLQLILIPLFTARLVSDLTVAMWFDLRVLPINNMAALAITVVVLFLLVRPKTRAMYKMN